MIRRNPGRQRFRKPGPIGSLIAVVELVQGIDHQHNARLCDLAQDAGECRLERVRPIRDFDG